MAWTALTPRDKAAGNVNIELHEQITAVTKEYRLADTLINAAKAVNYANDFLNSLKTSNTY
jgi:hypothetical protein